MIVKLICYLFGHKRREKAFTGYYDNGHAKVDPLGRSVALYVWQNNKICPRCGAKL